MHIVSERTEALFPKGIATLPTPSGDLGQAARPEFLHDLAIAVSAEIDSLQRISKLPSVASPLPERMLKRGLDLVASFFGLILLSPLFLVITLWVRRDSEGPIFYRQERIGKDDQPFKMIKFRTMVANAERMTGPVWAQEGDPRITRVGRFLRANKLDELPQLINVLQGEMSLVGPRPERPAFVNLFNRTVPGYRLRHQVLPGITGLAQVENGYDKEARDVIRKLKYDVRYIYEGSLPMDLSLICRTICRTILKNETR